MANLENLNVVPCPPIFRCRFDLPGKAGPIEQIFWGWRVEDGKLCEMEMGDAGISSLNVFWQREVANLSALLYSAFATGVRTFFIQAFGYDSANVASEAPTLDFIYGSKSDGSYMCVFDWGSGTQ